MNVLNSSLNFLGIEEESYFQFHNSKCVIQQLPYEYSSSYGSGSELGPSLLLQASHYVEFYDIELNKETYKECGICTLGSNGHSTKDPEQLMHTIAEDSNAILSQGKFLVSIGAEHSVSYGVFKAVQQHYPEVGVLQIDAHSDLRDSYEGSKWSHATVMRRISELGARLFQVGIRAQCSEEAKYMKSNPLIHCWYDHAIHDSDQWMDEVVSRLPKQLYITIDADGLASSVAPSVGTAEPGGLEWYTLLKFLKKVFRQTEVVGFDLLEFNPKTVEDRTAYTMAQLCYKLIGYKFCLR